MEIWKLKDSNHDEIEALSNALGLSKIISKILINRKITTPEAAKKFLNAEISQVHNPFLLKDMEVAVDRIIEAIQNKEKIYVYGDYDVDGAVATSLLILFFLELKYPIEFYIPNRMSEGYSLNQKAVEHLLTQKTNLIITVDNGIMAHSEIERAQQLGIDVIVTDHHQVGDSLPPAYAVVNPQRKDCDYPFKGICGAGVAFKLIMALRQKLREIDFFKDKKEPNLKNYLDLLAIATVCDVVPLVDENRYFVKEGLSQLEHTKKVGLRALLKVCGLVGRGLTSADLGFRLGPRINACGRLEDASIGVLLLTSQDESQAIRYAQLLNSLNQERRDLELQIVTEAIEKIKKTIDLNQTLGIALYEPDWHEGVVGIVASRLVSEFKRPTFVLTKTENGMIKGSGRSVGIVSLIDALNECQAYLEKFGGHEAAAGVTLKEENLKDFIKTFDIAIKKQMSFADLKETILVDEVLNSKEINERLITELKKLEPHGMGNSQPLFVSSDLQVKSKKIVGNDHLKLKVGADDKEFEVIAFRQSDEFDNIGEKTSAIFGLEMNRFRDLETIQLVVKKFCK